ncbi:5842_t:CDS:2, partial [Funneliformis geosporum]
NKYTVALTMMENKLSSAETYQKPVIRSMPWNHSTRTIDKYSRWNRNSANSQDGTANYEVDYFKKNSSTL